jgi:hypothetical protein
MTQSTERRETHFTAVTVGSRRKHSSTFEEKKRLRCCKELDNERRELKKKRVNLYGKMANQLEIKHANL